MQWHQFSSLSAPAEPDSLNQRRVYQHPISNSVPGNYGGSSHYHIGGFTAQPQSNIYGQQLNRAQMNGAPAHYHRRDFNSHLSNQIAPIYAGEQPFGFNFYETPQPGYHTQQNQLFSQQALSPTSIHEHDMDMEFDHESGTQSPMSAVTPQSFPTISEGIYQAFSFPSIAAPLPIPAQPMQSLASPVHESYLHETSSELHTRYTNHRLTNTSGDYNTSGSMLFSEDPPLPQKAPATRINHYITLEPLPQLDTKIILPPRGKAPPPANTRTIEPRQDSEPPETPALEGGIDSFCDRSFPQDDVLREALRVIMHSGKPAEAQDLHPFVEACDGKRWKCRFHVNGSPCGEVLKRRDAAVGHIRQVHIKMLPIPCKGDCGDAKCSRWFSSAATKGSHTRKGSVKCEKCHLLTSGRNLVRHQRTTKCHSVANAIAELGQ